MHYVGKSLALTFLAINFARKQGEYEVLALVDKERSEACQLAAARAKAAKEEALTALAFETDMAGQGVEYLKTRVKELDEATARMLQFEMKSLFGT